MVDKTILLCYNKRGLGKEWCFEMILPNKIKALSKVKKEKQIVANQCTCSNCNCNCNFSSNNDLGDLVKAYRKNLA